MKNLKIHIKNPVKRKHLLIVAMVSAFTVSSAIGIDTFFDRYDLKFRSPVVLQTPVLLEKRIEPLVSPLSVETVHAQEVTPSITATPTPKVSWIPSKETVITDTYIAQAENKWILWNVYALESSRGVNDGCKAKGKYNGFGFGQSDEKMAKGIGNCYHVFPAVVSEVDKWFTKQLKEKSLPEALCYYNTGHATSDCSYYQKFLKI